MKVWIWRLALLRLLLGFLPLSVFTVPLPSLGAVPPSGPSAPGSLLLFWGAGVLVHLALSQCRWLAARGVVRRSRPSPCAFPSTPGAGDARLTVRYSDEVTGPLLIYTGAPTILIPTDMAADPRTDMAIAHEVAHYRNGDAAWSPIVEAVSVLFFFLPLVPLAVRRLHLWQEIAADARAVAAAGIGPGAYAAMVLDFLARDARRLPASHASAFLTGPGYQKRLTHLYAPPHRPSHWPLPALAFACLGLLPWGPGSETPQEAHGVRILVPAALPPVLAPGTE